jgi:hypothetical protein
MRAPKAAAFPLAAFALLLTPAAELGAQGLQRPYKNNKHAVSYQIPQDLIQIPVNPGAGNPHLADKWSATKKPLYGRQGAYEWQAEVMVFKKEKVTTGPEKKKTKEELEKEAEEEKKKSLKERFEEYNTYANYSAWLDYYEDRARFTARGKKSKQRSGKKLPYLYYEFTKTDYSATWVTSAACYELDDRQVVISIYYPEEFRKKLARTVKRAIESLKEIEVQDDEVSLTRVKGASRYAKTPERKKALRAAVEAAEAVKGWDLFATEFYIVVYSYETDSSSRKSQRYRFAKDVARKMDSMSEQYRDYFPPHKKMKTNWSVLRICKDYEEFSKYGDTQPGVAGWFNRLSKELVIWDMPKSIGMTTDTVAFHEGFHQYSDQWFNGADTHTWMEEGFAEFFGSMGRSGSRWVPGMVLPRKKQLVALVERKGTVPFSEIITWSQSRFYSGNATDNYAQAGAMIDFLKRGEKSPYWQKRWETILPTYIKLLVETKDRDKALKTAFKNMNWDEFEEAYANYVLKSL